MRVTILGNYPVYKYAEKMGLGLKTNRRITSWNETLADALGLLDNVEIHVITGCSYIDRSVTIEDNGIKLTYLPMPHKRNIFTLFQYTRYLADKIIKKIDPDIVHGIGTEHIWPYIAINTRLPHIITVHGIISEVVKRSPPKLLSQQRFFAWLEPKVLAKTQHMISISPYVNETLEKTTRATIYNIENPVRELYFELGSSPDENEYLLYVGSITPAKGVDRLVRALGELRREGFDIPLVLAGPVLNPDYGRYLIDLATSLNVHENVVFKGFVLPEELADIYRKAAVLVLPSLQETAPMCIAESMAAGIPVVATNVGGVKYMIENGMSGYCVELENSEEMIDSIKRLWIDPELRKKMGDRGKVIATKRWKPSVIANKTRETYRKLVS
ncbi:MAG: glycosyltransferase family 4 protein [Candidatus Heimdallarchaeota archaeon]|nr:glycosyltransferase family 4 protein [Candidatus Heimdallarchaeota archaeon]